MGNRIIPYRVLFRPEVEVKFDLYGQKSGPESESIPIRSMPELRLLNNGTNLF